MSCKPYSLDNGREPRVRDDARGKTKFEIPDIEDIGLDEVRNKEGCSDYENHTAKSVFLGENSYLNSIVNCIAYNIDKGLKPVCEQEELAREELDKTRDDRYAEEIEVYLEELEYEKELFIDHIYELADPIYKQCGDMEDEIDKDIDRQTNAFGRAVLRLGSDVLFNSECRRVYRVMESKANLACIDLDFRSSRHRN